MLSNSRAAYGEHDHSRCIEAALHRATLLCEARKAKLTPIRESVLRLIWQSHKPLGAYEIVEKLPRNNGKRILAPTVYRSIEFLSELGLIHRIASLNAFIGCPFPESVHSDLFMICSECGTAAECSTDSVNAAIEAAVSKTGFAMDAQRVEVTGLCPQCQSSMNA
ncbi:MAG: Fur family transcriptional regulator [bacterium]